MECWVQQGPASLGRRFILHIISAREISLVSGDGCKIAQSSMNLDENFGLLKLHAGAHPDATIGRIDSFSDVM